jgi:hypothetical protein
MAILPVRFTLTGCISFSGSNHFSCCHFRRRDSKATHHFDLEHKRTAYRPQAKR